MKNLFTDIQEGFNIKLKETVKEGIKEAAKELIVVPKSSEYNRDYISRFFIGGFCLYGNETFHSKISLINEKIVKERKGTLSKLQRNGISGELSEIARKYAYGDYKNEEQLVKDISNLLKLKSYLNILHIYNIETSDIIKIGNCFIYPSIYDLMEKSENINKLKEEDREFIIKGIGRDIEKGIFYKDIPIFEIQNRNFTSSASIEEADLFFDEIAKIIRYFGYLKPVSNKKEESKRGFYVNISNLNYSSYSEKINIKSGTANMQDLFNDKIFDALIIRYNKENKTNLDKKIIDSVMWVGDAFTDFNIQLKFLKIISSFEILLLNNERSGLSEKVSKNIASLLYDDIKGQNECYKFFKDCYRIRSEIIHNGSSDNVTPFFTYKVINLHKELIEKILLKYLFKEYEELTNYIKLQGFD
ncbi:HEPN domain-containing protein [Methanolacinia paynteri]|uniref:HEPN domain-containing protein n=1 Tax=Methanolacinia paynteri TaxID=230356 RepID=UPI00064E3173|nr:HEPN domain-containing protein [Methanolacinia paynteri]